MSETNQTGHTPGPWKWDGGSGDGKRQFVASVEDDGWNCCRIEVDSDDCNSEMAKANARLIAAAPDMFSALKKLRRSDLPDKEQPLWNEICAAIQLAETGVR